MAGHRVVPFSVNRRMAAASAAVCRRRNTIHTIAEADVTEARSLLREHRARSGESLSFTAYVVACLARTVAEFPEMNALRKGRRLVLLNDVTVGTLVERRIGGELVPEPFGIRAADKLTYRQVHECVRAAQGRADERLGGLSGATWVRFIPSGLFRAFISGAARNVRMAERYGVVTVTAVGMHARSASPFWLVPLSASTVAVAVGGIVERTRVAGGRAETREHLCVTLSFDHDIVDGAPAARFTTRFAEILASGDLLQAAVHPEDDR